MDRTSVVIVGAGLAGLGVAWWLAGRARVRVIEQGGEPGAEASAQNAGMMRALVRGRAERTLALRSARWMRAPGEDWEGAAPFRPTGAVVGWAGEGDPRLRDAAADLSANGISVAEVDRPDAIARLAPALAGSRLARAWWLPDEGMVDAHTLVQGFLRGARARGARVDLGVEVRGLVCAGGRVVGVRTAAGEIAADAVVLAAGAWCARLAATAGLERPLVPLQRHLLHSDPHPVSSPDHPWCWIDDAGIYVRPEAGGWLCSPCDERPVEPPHGAGSRGPIEPEARATAIDRIDRLLPALRGVRFPRGWTGLRTFAPDRLPLLGADPNLAGLYWCAGLGGFGVTCCYSATEIVAASLLGESVAWIETSQFAPGRGFGNDRLAAT